MAWLGPFSLLFETFFKGFFCVKTFFKGTALCFALSGVARRADPALTKEASATKDQDGVGGAGSLKWPKIQHPDPQNPDHGERSLP